MESGIDSLLRSLTAKLNVQESRPKEAEDFESFYRAVLDWDVPAFQKPLLRPLQQERELLVLGPPGHSKSTLVGTYAAWQLGRDPNLTIIVATHTISYSELLLAFIESLLSSPAFQGIFGNLIPASGLSKWTANQKFVLRSDPRIKDPSLLALGVGSSTIGHRARLIICDDLVTQTNSQTPILRQHLSDWFWGSLHKRLEPGGQIIVIGARFYAQDLYNELLEFFPHCIFRASAKSPLWPERYPATALQQAERQNYFAYMAQYQQQPLDLETNFLNEAWLTYYLEAPPNLRIYQGVDPCKKARRGTDYFSLATVGVDINETAYLLDLFRLQATFAQQEELVISQATKWRPLIISIESNAFQEFLPDSILSHKALPINKIDNQFPKSIRFTTMATFFRNKKVLLPGLITDSGFLRPTASIMPFVEAWRSYPQGNSDVLDAVEMALSAAFGLGVLPATSTQEAVTSSQDEEPISRLPRRLFERETISLFH